LNRPLFLCLVHQHRFPAGGRFGLYSLAEMIGIRTKRQFLSLLTSFSVKLDCPFHLKILPIIGHFVNLVRQACCSLGMVYLGKLPTSFANQLIPDHIIWPKAVPRRAGKGRELIPPDINQAGLESPPSKKIFRYKDHSCNYLEFYSIPVLLRDPHFSLPFR
jgi:hypothetical protein